MLLIFPLCTHAAAGGLEFWADKQSVFRIGRIDIGSPSSLVELGYRRGSDCPAAGSLATADCEVFDESGVAYLVFEGRVTRVAARSGEASPATVRPFRLQLGDRRATVRDRWLGVKGVGGLDQILLQLEEPDRAATTGLCCLASSGEAFGFSVVFSDADVLEDVAVREDW